ncbi:hypothetical protein H5410_047180 [Solanum commersonii]|uniref:Uncharacterized protein n=1 Tax=Solanum commersonii TaxID=4109 RepID=A0A9J5XGF5_SOLCO|nr:hypothetical protein H5410_047180 [Solanum commersonii]
MNLRRSLNVATSDSMDGADPPFSGKKHFARLNLHSLIPIHFSICLYHYSSQITYPPHETRSISMQVKFWDRPKEKLVIFIGAGGSTFQGDTPPLANAKTYLQIHKDDASVISFFAGDLFCARLNNNPSVQFFVAKECSFSFLTTFPSIIQES